MICQWYNIIITIRIFMGTVLLASSTNIRTQQYSAGLCTIIKFHFVNITPILSDNGKLMLNRESSSGMQLSIFGVILSKTDLHNSQQMKMIIKFNFICFSITSKTWINGYI